MSRLREEETARIAKLRKLEEAGFNPYPSKTARTQTMRDCLRLFDHLLQDGKTITLAGRLRSKRGHGGLVFAHLEDGSGKIQIALRKNQVGEKLFKTWNDLIDVGDFVEVEGKLFLTKTGEKTLEVSSFRPLAKSLLPLPEKWHGLTDTEVRYRQRYLDLLSNPEVKNIFLKRAKIVNFLRKFLDQTGFIEVETPVLQAVAGGAAAKPFRTHHNSLDTDLFLRIAPELYLKRLIVGGFERVYEFARCFRNEGIDREHNPEFTQVEFYWAYADYETLMRFTEEMLTKLLLDIHGSVELEHEGVKLNFNLPWPRRKFRDLLLEAASIDIDKATNEKSLLEEIKKNKLKIDTSKLYGYGDLAEALYKDFIRPKIIQPTFVIDYPAAMIPLAKRKEDDKTKIATFQLLVKGMEICKAYNELNDPLDQEKRFKEQEKLRARGAEEIGMTDKDFLDALRHGMPPTAGFGMGIDRLTALLTNSHNLKEVILFPTLKPQP